MSSLAGGQSGQSGGQSGGIRLGTAQGRGVVFATVLGSGISFLDSTIMNVALPSMDRTLHLGVAGIQWTTAGYLLTLSALLLTGGSLGDLFGRRRTYLQGLAIFTAGSAVCGLAGSAGVLVGARLVQGVGGALMVPGSLAIIQSVFVPEDRGAAVGAWIGLSATWTALGPLAGGALVTWASWRWAFYINVPLAAVCWWSCRRWVPESRNEESEHRLDVAGTALVTLGLAGVTTWSIEGSNPHFQTPALAGGLLGIALLVAFLWVEKRSTHPMLPLSMFSSSQFNWVNVVTVIFYGAFVSALTLVPFVLQEHLGYSPLESGLAFLPTNVALLLLSKRAGKLAQRIGPKLPMTLGPMLAGAGLAWLSQLRPGRGYVTFTFPALVVWSIGLALTVGPLTAAALGAADQRRIGVASALNNAASRVGQSLAIALLPVVAGIGGLHDLGGSAFLRGYERAALIAAGLCAVAGGLSFLTVQGGRHTLQSAE